MSHLDPLRVTEGRYSWRSFSKAVIAEHSLSARLTEVCGGAVDDLMRMVSGIEWSEAASVSREQGKAANVVGEMLYEAQDAAAFVGGLPQNATPGKYYNYSTGNYQLVQYNLRQGFLLPLLASPGKCCTPRLFMRQ